MIPLDTINYAIWIAGPLLQASLAIMMLLKKTYREFPVFFAYTVSHVVRAALLFGIYRFGSEAAYFYSYYSAELVDAIISFAVVYELYNFVFKPYDALADLGALLFKWAFAILIVFCIVSGFLAPGADINRVTAGVIVLQRSSNILIGGLLLLLMLFCKTFGVAWRSYAMGIALGLGVTCSVAAAGAAIRSGIPGVTSQRIFVLVNTSAYLVAIGVWIAYLVSPAYARDQRTTLPEHSTVQRWNHALEQLMNR